MFKVGDKVSIKDNARGIARYFIGRTGFISGSHPGHQRDALVWVVHIGNENVRCWPEEIELMGSKATPHKHACVIKAWADGAEIQFRSQPGGTQKEWKDVSDPDLPLWIETLEYRVKPEPKPDTSHEVLVRKLSSGGVVTANQSIEKNLKLTFDGETGKLKDAQVL